ncbi:pitrilysin family protein [Fontisphaera persica]|uniref:M16 family metallopeptidase n=1 Tax=Fontisphaera persica TaxID=2974023 RepID=UPI0024C00961|nr:pitrilysin family protein [Fontisphaera persica]WCJ58071.1 pitrilysin family protein [Fontisphaera persica]
MQSAAHQNLAPRQRRVASGPAARVITLDHGLQIIVREDHSAPVASVQAWCKAGSIHEGRWLGAGLSHVLEHMLFKGTTTRPGAQIDREVQSAGGYINAYTSFDRTVYYIDVPNTGVQVALDILCDIMQNASLPEEEMAREMEVIRREMDMTHDDPGQRSARRLFETAYTRSPYRFTVIGYPDIFNELKREDVLAYYREKYAPNNLFFVVVGDVDAAAVEQRIRQNFAHAKARPLPPMVLPEEPRQLAAREVIEEAPIALAHVHFSWHIPDLRHPDVPALDVLATILGSGRSSRLYQTVRERLGLVNSIEAWTYSPGNPGLFGMSAVMDANKLEAARAAMLDEIEKLKSHPIKPAELQKAIKQFTSATLATRKTMAGQAQDLGASWLAAGDLDFSTRYLQAVKKTTAADLQRVARQYLTEENRTCYALTPPRPNHLAAPSITVARSASIEKFTLPNGLRVLLKEDHRLPFVEFRAVLRGGVLAETLDTSGLTTLMTRLLLKGTRKRSAERLAREIESLGGSMDTYGGNQSFGLNVEVLQADFTRGLDLLADALLHPVFPAEALERERQVQLASLENQRDQILPYAARLMRRVLFGPAGYGLDSLGETASVQKLSLADLQQMHRQLVVPSNCVLAIFGDVQTGPALKAIEKMLGRWRGRLALPPLPQPPALTKVVRHTETLEKKQALVIIGFPGVTLFDPDRHALELLQEACSDLGSRLFMRIRDQLGLAYYVGAQNFLGLTPGFFAFYAGTEPGQAALCEAEMLAEATLLRREGLAEEELQRAKAKLLGQRKIARQDLGHQAMAVALDELYGLGCHYFEQEDARIQGVTLEQVRAAAEKYLCPERMVVVVINPQP